MNESLNHWLDSFKQLIHSETKRLSSWTSHWIIYLIHLNSRFIQKRINRLSSWMNHWIIYLIHLNSRFIQKRIKRLSSWTSQWIIYLIHLNSRFIQKRSKRLSSWTSKWIICSKLDFFQKRITAVCWSDAQQFCFVLNLKGIRLYWVSSCSQPSCIMLVNNLRRCTNLACVLNASIISH